MSQKMKNAPILFTVGQVRFNPILQMGSFVSAIQESFRKMRFIGFAQDEVKGIQVDTRTPTPEVQVRTEQRWRFIDAQNTSEFLLLNSALTFQTTAYDTKETFLNALLKGVELVHNAVQLEYVERIGIRTIDAVVPQAGKKLEDYLKPQLLGFYESSLSELKQNILEAAFLRGTNSHLVSRVVILRGALGLPIDLLPIILTIDSKFTATNGDHAILDNDRNEQIRFDFNLDKIREKFLAFKVDVSQAFYNAVTPEALDHWR